MRKKSFLLAFLLALTAVGPVRTAAAQTVMQSEITLVAVTVPATGRIVLNPYGLPVEIDGGTSTEQIVSETLTITNNSASPVRVQASATGRVSALSSLAYAVRPPAETGAKEIFLYAEFQQADGLWRGEYLGLDNQILIAEGISAPKEVLALDGNGEGIFRLFGAATTYPDDPWGSEDEVSVTFTFTFTADLPEAAANREPAGEEGPSEEPIQEPVETPAAVPSETPAKPSQEPAEEPSQSVAEPAEEPIETPAEPVESPTEEPVEPSQEPAEDENQDPVPSDREESVETNGETDSVRLEAGVL